MTAAMKKMPDDIRLDRVRVPASTCSGLVVAALWPKHETNPGTMARTCDASGVDPAACPVCGWWLDEHGVGCR